MYCCSKFYWFAVTAIVRRFDETYDTRADVIAIPLDKVPTKLTGTKPESCTCRATFSLINKIDLNALKNVERRRSNVEKLIFLHNVIIKCTGTKPEAIHTKERIR